MDKNKDIDRQQKPKPQAGQQQGGGRKNEEEVGEPVQLNEDKPKQGQQDQQGKPGMGQREGVQPGQHQGGGKQ
jgi:hypothetical protein